MIYEFARALPIALRCPAMLEAIRAGLGTKPTAFYKRTAKMEQLVDKHAVELQRHLTRGASCVEVICRAAATNRSGSFHPSRRRGHAEQTSCENSSETKGCHMHAHRQHGRQS